MYERGVRLFVELPPGRVLTALVAAGFPDARAVACGETRIDSICALVRRESGRTFRKADKGLVQGGPVDLLRDDTIDGV
jgi:hypothetical protein